MLAMEICGIVCLGIFALYERFVASHPLMPQRILVNRAFIAIVTVDFWYFVRDPMLLLSDILGLKPS